MTEGLIINNGILELCNINIETIIIPDAVKIIGDDAFKGLTNVKKVVLPDTVTHIGDRAFKGCKNLAQIIFPQHLESIGEYAFHRCHSIKSLVIPETIKEISNCAFLYCDSLEYVSMIGATFIGKQAFVNNYNLKKIVVSSKLDIDNISDVFTGCSKISNITLTDGTVCELKNIIDVLSGQYIENDIINAIAKDVYRMMSIKDGILLKMLANAKELEIPEGIIGIGKSCFFDKKGIVSIKLPRTLRHISSRAFRNCINLEKVEFQNNEVNIEKDAFKNCTTLKYIKLPNDKVYKIEGCINNSDDKPSIVGTIHKQILSNFKIYGTTLYEYKGNEERVVVPNGITTIAERAFACNDNIGRVVLPDSVKEIGQECFKDCVTLQTVKISNGLISIEKSAFENCLKLISVSIPEGVEVLEDSVFKRCMSLKEAILTEGTRFIECCAFYGCKSLKKIILPKQLEYIGDMAFYKCMKINKITLPRSLREIGSNVFTGSKLRYVQVECDLEDCGSDVFSQCPKLKKITFSEDITFIGDRFAYQCESLEEVDLPKNLMYIGKNAFDGSKFLDNIDPSGIQDHILLDGSNYEGDVIIEKGITTIAGGAFYNNHKITSVIIPQSITSIGARSFCSCSQLKRCELPSKVTIIEEGTFAYCNNLVEVTTNGRIDIVNNNAFYGCENLIKVPIGNVQTIGANAYNGCYPLDLDSINPIYVGDNAFRNTHFLEAAKKISPLVIVSNIVIDGGECKGQVDIPEGVIGIKPYAFARNTDITNIKLPETLVYIDKGAFSGCKGLTEINLPKSTKNIGKNAFEKCTELVKIEGYAAKIEEGAFSYCTQLKEIELEGTSYLGKEVFCGCQSLEKIQCKDVRIIGQRCFSDCHSITDFDFSNIVRIENYAFDGCYSLSYIDLGQSTYVENYAFKDCCKVKSIKLDSVKIQHECFAFSGCTALQKIYIKDNIYKVGSWDKVFTREIPEQVKEIYFNAMSCYDIDDELCLMKYKSNAVSVTIPLGIQKIDQEVFKDNLQLEDISVPESVKFIGQRAFTNTPWLESKGEEQSLVVINNNLIYANNCPKKVIIPNRVKRICGWAFANCFEVEHLVFEQDIIIELYAFRNCINIKDVEIKGQVYKLTSIQDRDNSDLPDNVRQIFSDCLNCYKTDEQYRLIECTGNIRDINLISGFGIIGDSSFQMSNLLTNIILPDDISVIQKGAFEQCKWLETVNNMKNVRVIEKQAFSRCYSLVSIDLPEELEYLGEKSFEYCSKLKKVVIGEGVTIIPKRAFYRCTNLESVQLPSTVQSIEEEAFAFCYKLKDINITDSITNVGDRAFEWCNNLKDI